MNYQKFPDQARIKGQRNLADLADLTTYSRYCLALPIVPGIVAMLESMLSLDPVTTLDLQVSKAANQGIDPAPMFGHPEVNEIKTFGEFYEDRT